MESVFFILSLIGVLAIMYWAATNDAAGNRGATKGFFAMRDFAAEEAEAAAAPAEAKPAKRR
jgi:hypothetical protein